jgi:hypothetical protein
LRWGKKLKKIPVKIPESKEFSLLGLFGFRKQF